jgi:hypothetical protein
MRGRGIAFVVAGLIALAVCASVAAADPNDSSITVIGNRHVGADMVRSFFHAAPGGKLPMTRSSVSMPPAYSAT